MVVSLGEVEKYYFRLGDSGDYIESATNEYTFEGLAMNTEYTVYMKVLKADGEESIEYTETVTTKDITGEVTITKNPNIANEEYTNKDIKVTLSYAEEIDGYELQYKTSETEWITYIGEITITQNTTVYGRLYNITEKDEKASNSVSISCIDKTAPTIDSIAESDVTDNSFKVNINVTDAVSGIQSYTLYINGEEYETVETTEKTATILVSNRSGNTTYTCYAIVKDKAGNEITSSEISIVTPADSTAPTIELVNVEYVATEYAKVTLRVKDETSEVKNILKDGNIILDASLEKLEDELYVYNVINNGEVTFSATDTSDNVNSVGVSVNITGLKYDSLVKYTDKLDVECFTVQRTASGYANVGYFDYADSECVHFYRSASGSNYIIFNKQLEMKQGTNIEMKYDMFNDGGTSGPLEYGFIQNLEDYDSTTYTTIDTATTATINYTGDEGKYYLVLRINHVSAVNTTNVRIYDLKIYNDPIAPTVELVDVEYSGTEYANITLRIKDNFSGVASILKDGVVIDDTLLEKLEDDMYLYKARRNKEFKFTAKDNAGNVNEEGVTVTIDKLEDYEVGLVSYTDKLNVDDIIVHASASSYNNPGYFDYADEDLGIALYRSANGTNYYIFNEELDMAEGTKLTIDYDIYDDRGGTNATFSYAFVQDPTAYESASYTKIATSTSKTPTRTNTAFEYTGEEGTYYLVLKLVHPLGIYTTYVGLYDLKVHI